MSTRFGDLKVYEAPNQGVGGNSIGEQESESVVISNGGSGTATAGGLGVFNSNGKSNIKYSTGGGSGGSSSDASGQIGTGGGGTGRVGASGTAGGGGYIKIKRYNLGTS